MIWEKRLFIEIVKAYPPVPPLKKGGVGGGEKEVNKSVWGMPRLSEAKKDVISCEKLRGSANRT